MQPSATLGDTRRVLRLVLASWAPFALIGTAMAVVLVFPTVRMDLSPLERAGAITENAWRVRLGALFFAARGGGELFACFGLLVFARRLPGQPGVVAATVAACAALAAVAVDASGAYLFGHVLPSRAALAVQQGGPLDLPSTGGGLLGALADLLEQMLGSGREEAMSEFLRVEALAFRRAGAYGPALHIVAAIGLYASAASFEPRRRAPSLTAATLFSVVVRAVAAGAFYASLQEPTGYYPHLGLGGVALASGALVDVWMALAVAGRAEAAWASAAAGE